MLGAHYAAADYSQTGAHKLIVRDFVHNEEGYLSTSYINILKKYYTLKDAEFLYVLTGLSIIKGLRSIYHAGHRDAMLERMASVRAITFAPALGTDESFGPVEQYLTSTLRLLGLNSTDQYDYRVLEHLMPADFGSRIQACAALIAPQYSGNWWSRVGPIKGQLEKLLDGATADNLQAMFHLPPFSGYDGAEVLTRLMNESRMPTTAENS